MDKTKTDGEPSPAKLSEHDDDSKLVDMNNTVAELKQKLEDLNG